MWSPRGIWSRIWRPWRWGCGGRGLPPGSSSSWWPENRWRAAQSPCSQSDDKTSPGFTTSCRYLLNSAPVDWHVIVAALPATLSPQEQERGSTDCYGTARIRAQRAILQDHVNKRLKNVPTALSMPVITDISHVNRCLVRATPQQQHILF